MQINSTQAHIFTQARTPSHWLPKPVSETQLRALYELVKLGPTSMNSQPMRLQFVISAAAKMRLVECVNPGNHAKTMAAPVVAIIGHDLHFPATLGRLFPHKQDAVSYYEGKPEFVAATALRNSSLQGAYLIMAARSMGLDCGPMSGFDSDAVDRAFWDGTTVRTNFLCNIGYGDSSQLRPRGPRLEFDEVCQVI